MFGVFIQEYGSGVPVKEYENYNVHTVKKVIDTDKPLPKYDDVLFTGRYGAWDKKILTHHVYDQVIDWLLPRSKYTIGKISKDFD